MLDAITAFLLDPDTFVGYLLGALGTWTDVKGHDITLGELGLYENGAGADITLGELAQYLPDSVSLADVLLGLVPVDEFPFEDFPVDSLGLNVPGRTMIAGFGSSTTASPISVFFRMLYSAHPFRAERPRSLRARSCPGLAAASPHSAATLPATPDITTEPDGRVRVEVPVPVDGVRARSPAWTLTFMDNGRTRQPSHRQPARGRDQHRPQTSSYDFLDSVDGAEPNTPIETISSANPGFVGVP